MGYDLFNGKDYLRANISLWPRILNLAFIYGWIPKGTITDKSRNPDKPWDGNYLSNYGQCVTAEDASEIAEALEKAILEIPGVNITDEDDPLISRISTGMTPEAFIDSLFQDANYDITQDNKSELLSYFSHPAYKQRLKEFIYYCRVGSFTIH